MFSPPDLRRFHTVTPAATIRMTIDAPTATNITQYDEPPVVEEGPWFSRSSQFMSVEGFWQLHLRSSKDTSCNCTMVMGEGGRGHVSGAWCDAPRSLIIFGLWVTDSNKSNCTRSEHREHHSSPYRQLNGHNGTSWATSNGAGGLALDRNDLFHWFAS